MKRPQFFIDLDKSLSVEEESEEAPTAPIAVIDDLHLKGEAIAATEAYFQGLAEQTATGTMIAASLQRESWYYEQLKQLIRQQTTPRIFYDPHL